MLSLSVCVCVCACVSVSVTSRTATPLTHRYKVRYESNANALLKVLTRGFRKKILCSKVRPYLFDLTLLGPDRPHFGRLQIKMIVTSYVNTPHARAHSSAQISDFSMAVL